MNQATFTSYHNLAKKDNNRRIWLEGEPLLRAGFQPGDFFEAVLNMDTLAVTLNHIPDSKEARARHARKEIRKVSRRNMGTWLKPIVDVCNADITQLFGEFARFRAQAFAGRIVFSVHPEDLKQAQREQRFKHNVKRGIITKGDAFLGFGIASHAIKQGFANEGLKTKQKWAVEIEARYLDVAAKNDPEAYRDAHLFCASVEEVEKDLLEPVDAFSFSMPCTNHSLAGRTKKGLANAEMGDEVTALFGVVEMIKAVNPAILISENVPQAKDSITYQLLIKELHRLGYKTHEMILDQDHSGALERRRRYWFVAYSSGLNVNVDSLMPVKRAPHHANVADILEVQEAEGNWHDLSKLQKRETINLENGRNFKMNLVDGDSTYVSTIPRNYYKHQVSNPHVVRSDLGAYRLFTKNEHASLKNIPHHLVANASHTMAHEGLGQSIVYFHGVGVAESTMRSLSLDNNQLGLNL